LISYCIVAYRPWYARRLITDLIHKTTSDYEILIWLNVEDVGLEQFLADKAAAGCRLRVVGRTPQNIGMAGLRALFTESRYELITQIDDDVICVSPRIAEIANSIFAALPQVKQLVADVWQDEFTTGARPEWSHYRAYDVRHGLYAGPIDGWFSIYHRSILPLLSSVAFGQYFSLGCAVKAKLAAQGWCGLLCKQFKVFHVIGPAYASYFDALDFEIAKYARLGRREIVAWYEASREQPADLGMLQAKVQQIEAALTEPPSPETIPSFVPET
jgi:hypothetical protein